MAAHSNEDLLTSLDFTGLLYSLSVAEHLGFRRAAAALDVQESMVSRKVRTLEDRLQVSLFERHAQGVRLTVAGERFLDQARSAVREIHYAAASARAAGRGEQGRLKIGFFTPLSGGFLRKLLQRYAADHPDVSIELREGSRRHHLTLVRERRLDVTFATGTTIATGCEVAELWSEPVYVALPRGHRLANRVEISWTDLTNERFIVSQSECGAEVHDHVVRHMARLGYDADVNRVAVGHDTLINLVAMSFGISLVTQAAISTPVIGVAFRPLAAPVDEISFSAAWSPENDNPALRQFISLAHVLAGKPRRGTSDWTGHAA